MSREGDHGKMAYRIAPWERRVGYQVDEVWICEAIWNYAVEWF